MSKRNRQKTRFEQRKYHNSIHNLHMEQDSTVDVASFMLKGSADLEDERVTQQSGKYRKKPIKYVLWDYIKKHPVVSGLITTMIIAIFGFVLDTKINIAVITDRISTINSSISILQEDSVEKDYLQAQIDFIKSEIDNEYILDFNNIRWRLSNIEDKLEDVHNELDELKDELKDKDD